MSVCLCVSQCVCVYMDALALSLPESPALARLQMCIFFPPCWIIFVRCAVRSLSNALWSRSIIINILNPNWRCAHLRFPMPRCEGKIAGIRSLLTDLQSEQIRRRCFPLQNWVKCGGFLHCAISPDLANICTLLCVPPEISQPGGTGVFTRSPSDWLRNKT